MFTKEKLFYLILVCIFLIHILVISINIFNKKKETIKISSNKKFTIRNVMLNKKKIIKKRIAPPKSNPTPVIATTPFEIEKLFEEEDDDEELPEINFSDIGQIEFTEPTKEEVGLSDDQLIDIREQYIREIYANINIEQTYPKIAKKLNQEGTTEVLFTVLKDGTIIDVKLSKSSRFSSIDKAAISAVKKIGKLSPIPKELARESWELILPIRYELF